MRAFNAKGRRPVNKVLLIYPPIYFIESVMDRPPLGILYLASILEKWGIDVRVLDLALEPKISLQGPLSDFAPDVVGISVSTPQFKEARRIARAARKILPEAVIVAGGPHPSLMPMETLMGTEFDIAVAGEGEQTFPELIRALSGIEVLSRVSGIYYKSEGKIRRTAPRQYIDNINEIPFPARHAVPIKKYSMEINSVRATSVITSRGCPYGCVYCNKSIFGNKCRFRDAANIISEIKEITDKYDVRGILFVDDTFTISPVRTREICDGIIREKLDITWRCWTRPNSVDRSLLEKMYASGCREVGFGVESGDQEILDRSKKGETVKSNLNAIKAAKAAGLNTKAFFMVGLPGENKRSINNTIRFIREARPDSADFYITTPFPKTSLWIHAEELGIRILSRNWDSYYHAGKGGDAPAVIETEELSVGEIIRMQKRLREEFDKLQKGRLERSVGRKR